MPRLSSPVREIKDHYTVLVIGSGYGGAIAASRLARAGQQVCVLERGREFQNGEYPDTEAEALATFCVVPAVCPGHATSSAVSVPRTQCGTFAFSRVTSAPCARISAAT